MHENYQEYDLGIGAIGKMRKFNISNDNLNLHLVIPRSSVWQLTYVVYIQEIMISLATNHNTLGDLQLHENYQEYDLRIGAIGKMSAFSIRKGISKNYRHSKIPSLRATLFVIGARSCNLYCDFPKYLKLFLEKIPITSRETMLLTRTRYHWKARIIFHSRWKF